MRNRFPSWQALILLPLLSLGCYVPKPADLGSIAPGEEFRIVLSDEGRERLSELSTEAGGELSGQLLNLTGDSLTITTRLRGPAYAPGFGNLRQAMSFARSDIDQVTVPQLDRVRTSVIVAGALVVAVTVVAALLDFVGSNDSTTDPTDPTAPFFRLSW